MKVWTVELRDTIHILADTEEELNLKISKIKPKNLVRAWYSQPIKTSKEEMEKIGFVL
jgi:hypothetical protein